MPVALATALGMGLVLGAEPASAADSLEARPRPPEPIVGGQPTTPHEFDSAVAIRAGPGLCSGTVVSSRVVLTAAHCLASLRSSDEITVYYGDALDSQNSGPAADFGVHPDFCPKDCKHDIHDYGYVLLGSDFVMPNGAPFVLPLVDQGEWDASMGVGDPVTVVGYGKDPEIIGADEGIGVKREVQTKIDKLTSEGLEFFAGGNNRDSCEGDSGGPAFVQLDDGTWRLAGITSRGSDPCGDGGYYGIPFAALTWLRDQTGADFLPKGCEKGDCLHTAPDTKGCRIGGEPSRPAAAILLALVLLGVRRRR